MNKSCKSLVLINMSQNDNIQQKITFFENSNDVMEQIAKSENDRLQLEIQLNRLINSDESLYQFNLVNEIFF